MEKIYIERNTVQETLIIPLYARLLSMITVCDYLYLPDKDTIEEK